MENWLFVGCQYENHNMQTHSEEAKETEKERSIFGKTEKWAMEKWSPTTRLAHTHTHTNNNAHNNSNNKI